MTERKLKIVVSAGEDWILHKGHPESPERIKLAQELVLDMGHRPISPFPVNPGQIKEVQIIEEKIKIPPAHQMAAGAVRLGCELMTRNEKALIIARPPGHHSPRLSYGNRGFCLINNEAIGLTPLFEKKPDSRIAIIDTDAHHGDGNEDFFFYDPRILHISIHQDGRTIFPGTGSPRVIGAHKNVRNIPLPPQADDRFLFWALKNLVLPEVKAFDPTFIIHNTGFDAHRKDPLSWLNFSEEIMGVTTELLQPDLTIIQGGYELKKAFPLSLQTLIKSLENKTELPSYSLTSQISEALSRIKESWKEGQKELNEKKKSGSIEREVSFFYDDAFFQEHRWETYYPCSHCSGVLQITSYREKTKEFVLLFQNNCPECQKRAQNLASEKGAIVRNSPF